VRAVGFFEYVGDITPLKTEVRFMRYCETCDTEETFVAAWSCDAGLVGCCIGCGAERIARFTHSSEAA
jgi:hypothetical protein